MMPPRIILTRRDTITFNTTPNKRRHAIIIAAYVLMFSRLHAAMIFHYAYMPRDAATRYFMRFFFRWSDIFMLSCRFSPYIAITPFHFLFRHADIAASFHFRFTLIHMLLFRAATCHIDFVIWFCLCHYFAAAAAAAIFAFIRHWWCRHAFFRHYWYFSPWYSPFASLSPRAMLVAIIDAFDTLFAITPLFDVIASFSLLPLRFSPWYYCLRWYYAMPLCRFSPHAFMLTLLMLFRWYCHAAHIVTRYAPLLMLFATLLRHYAFAFDIFAAILYYAMLRRHFDYAIISFIDFHIFAIDAFSIDFRRW